MAKQIVKTNGRDNYFEFIRGICIICVVLIHSQNGITQADLTTNSFDYNYWLISRQFINFPVAIFVFITAYFTNITKISQRPVKYFISRVKRLVIPFLFWSLFYSAINVVKQGVSVDATKITVDIIEGRAATPLYYIVILLQLLILTPILISCLKNKYLNLMAFSITPIYLIIIYTYIYVTKQQIRHYESVFPAWLIFYYLGLYIKINGFKIKKTQRNVKRALVLLGGTLLFSIIECYLMLYLQLPVGFASSQIKISSFVYSISIINLIFVLKDSFNLKKDSINLEKDNFVTKIGNCSYGIFYIHYFYIMIFSEVITYIPFLNKITPLYQLIQLLVILTLSISSIIITNKLIGKKLASKFLGF